MDIFFENQNAREEDPDVLIVKNRTVRYFKSSANTNFTLSSSDQNAGGMKIIRMGRGCENQNAGGTLR